MFYECYHRSKKKLVIPSDWKKGKWILAGTFNFQPSEIDELDTEEFYEWLEGAEEINKNNGNNI